MLDVHCTLLPDANAPLKHNAEIKFFLGSAEVMGRVRLLGVQELLPGQAAFIQVMLQEPVAALRGDRFIIRRPSPPATIGGGQVIDPNPKRRYKRFNQQRINELEQLLIGTPEEIFLHAAHTTIAAPLKDLIEASGLESKIAAEAVEYLLDQGELIPLKGNKLLIAADILSSLESKITADLADYHLKHPLHMGMPKEQLKSQVNLEINVFDAVSKRMMELGVLQAAGPILKLAQHQISYTPDQQAKIDTLMAQFDEQPYTPPSVKQSEEWVGVDVLISLIQNQRLIRLGEDVLLKPGVYQEMEKAVIGHIQSHGNITLAELRDQFNTSRKYAVALLEHLDTIGITVRTGDKRKLRNPS
jgi:selenocysteine-specific elongation factor